MNIIVAFKNWWWERKLDKIIRNQPPEPEWGEWFSYNGGKGLLRVHKLEDCKRTPCTIHSPSDHHMRDWPLHWRGDRGIFERICSDNGTGHPDPDTAWELKTNGDSGIHGCDGCCHAPAS